MASLTSLPPELYSSIINDLSYNDVQALRLSCRTLFALLQPNHSQLLEAENESRAKNRNLLACIGCIRLRHSSSFSTKMRTPPPPPYLDLVPYDFVTVAMASVYTPEQREENRPGTAPHKRFCNECGLRDLPGLHRYNLGDRWDDEYDIWYVRCIRCEKIKIAQAKKGAKLCFRCHSDDVDDERRQERQLALAAVAERDSAQH